MPPIEMAKLPPFVNPVPVIVTVVSPAEGPEVGEMPEIVGPATAVNAPVSVTDCPSLLVSLTLLAPVDMAAGVTQVALVALT